jgi:hypothetical protein
MVRLSNLSSRDKDNLIDAILKLSEDTKMTRTASSPMTGAMADQAEQAIQGVFYGPNGLKRTAFAMKTPLKTRLDYVAVGRNRLLLVDELAQGAIPAYDLDNPEFGGTVLGARGTAPMVQANIKRIVIPTFPIAVNHTIKYEEIEVRLYPAFDRAKERAAIGLAIAEDDEIMRVCKVAAEANPAGIIDLTGGGGTTQMTRYHLADGFSLLMANQLIAATVLMHPTRYADVLKFNTTDLDQVSVNTIVEGGLFGVIYGARLLVSTRVPIENTSGKGSVYVSTTPDKLGRIPERKSVEVKIFDNIPETRYDCLAFEQIGVGVHNNGGIVKILYTNS